jgi:catechol 2,3-dioxygenase
MKAHYLGHVVFYVKDLERSLAFYRDLLGFNEVGQIFNGAARLSRRVERTMSFC